MEYNSWDYLVVLLKEEPKIDSGIIMLPQTPPIEPPSPEQKWAIVPWLLVKIQSTLPSMKGVQNYGRRLRQHGWSAADPNASAEVLYKQLCSAWRNSLKSLRGKSRQVRKDIESTKVRKATRWGYWPGDK